MKTKIQNFRSCDPALELENKFIVINTLIKK